MLAKMPTSRTGLSSLVSPLYAPGHVLMDDDLTSAVGYTRSLSRLLFRSVFGCGVICGFCVDAKLDCSRLVITVQPGVALDCCGEPIEMRTAEILPVGEDCHEQLPSPLWVLIRRCQHACAPRELACPSDDEDDACGCHATRQRAGYELKVVKDPPRCECGCGDLKAWQPPPRPKPIDPQPPSGGPKPTADPGRLQLAPAGTPERRVQLERLVFDRDASRRQLDFISNEMIATQASLNLARAQVDASAGKLAEAQAGKPTDAAGKQLLENLTAERDAAANRQEELAAQFEKLSATQRETMQDAASHELNYRELVDRGGQDAGDLQRAGSEGVGLIAPRKCHEDHYAGVCGCCCEGECDGWVLLAAIDPPQDPGDPKALDPRVFHSVRRFIRPVLAADPCRDIPTTDASKR